MESVMTSPKFRMSKSMFLMLPGGTARMPPFPFGLWMMTIDFLIRSNVIAKLSQALTISSKEGSFLMNGNPKGYPSIRFKRKISVFVSKRLPESSPSPGHSFSEMPSTLRDTRRFRCHQPGQGFVRQNPVFFEPYHAPSGKTTPDELPRASVFENVISVLNLYVLIHILCFHGAKKKCVVFYA